MRLLNPGSSWGAVFPVLLVSLTKGSVISAGSHGSIIRAPRHATAAAMPADTSAIPTYNRLLNHRGTLTPDPKVPFRVCVAEAPIDRLHY